MFITPALSMRTSLKVLKLVKFWLSFVAVKLPELPHLYASWLSEALALYDILRAVLNSAGFSHVAMELQ